MGFKKINNVFQAAVFLVLASISNPSVSGALPAFPGCEGWGCDSTVGGRGGKVLHVNTLVDTETNSDPSHGSLRWALRQNYPRIIVFDVSGTIILKSDIWVSNRPYVTVAGQTAPGDGIQVTGGAIRFQTNQIIVRGMRIRAGDDPGDPLSNRDCLSVENNSGNRDVVIDHNSFQFSVDGATAAWFQSERVTFSYNIMGKPLVNCQGCEPNHGLLHLLGGSIKGGTPSRNLTIHHNLYSSAQGRMPALKQDTHAEVINNVIYNQSTSYGSYTHSRSAWIGNYWKAGPMRADVGLLATCNGAEWCNLASNQVYMSQNVCPNRPSNSGDEKLCFTSGSTYYSTSPPFPLSGINIDSPSEAYSKVLGPPGFGAGAFHRDVLDQGMIDEVWNNTGRSSLCSSEACYGGWPTLTTGAKVGDSDGDGIPDSWEAAHGLDPNRSSDAGSVAPSGYTWIEEYINSFFPASGSSVSTLTRIPNPPSSIDVQ